MTKIKLIVLDCDGVISVGEAQPFSLELFSRLADLNRRARRGEEVPAVTLNTGRPSPYVEAVLQAIEGWQPALYESGAGMYFPQTYQFATTSLLTAEHQTALHQIIRQIDRQIVQPGYAYWQPGKTICHTLFAHPPLKIADFLPDVEAIVTRVSPEFIALPAVLALNIYPAGINKGTGLTWLAQETGINPAEMAGVGDSSGDLDFLNLVGQRAAPGNASDDVKAVASYVSPYKDTGGLMDILDWWPL
jgi:hydroxymethylpyrimidine pyrophosphatase-like HAD family hydrolase